MIKKLAIGVASALAINYISRLTKVPSQITSSVTSFKLNGWRNGAFQFSIRVGFDNHSKISIPLDNITIAINLVKGGGEKTLVAKSNPTTDKYVLTAQSRTTLDDILIEVGALVMPSAALLMLRNYSNLGNTLKFEVVSTAEAAGQTVTDRKIFPENKQPA